MTKLETLARKLYKRTENQWKAVFRKDDKFVISDGITLLFIPEAYDLPVREWDGPFQIYNRAIADNGYKLLDVPDMDHLKKMIKYAKELRKTLNGVIKYNEDAKTIIKTPDTQIIRYELVKDELYVNAEFLKELMVAAGPGLIMHWKNSISPIRFFSDVTRGLIMPVKQMKKVQEKDGTK